jgi:hypothetical protein
MNNRTFQADDKLNDFSDRDEMWGPLLFLRPEPHQAITLARALSIAAVLGGFYGTLGNVMLALMVRGGGGYQPSLLMMPLLLTGMYFVCGQLSIFGAWNRRARLLTRHMSWVELTRRAPPQRPRDDETAAD